MALMLNFFYFIIFCSIHCVKSEKCQLQGNCPDDQKFQSPINIPCDCRTKKCNPTINHGFPALQLENFDSSADITITNIGHTLQSSQAQSASIKGGPLKKVYNFAQVHFHWGSTNMVGSEHQINSKSYPLEAHFVFSRSYEVNTSIRESGKMNNCANEIKSTKSCDTEAETEKRTESNGNWCDKHKKTKTHSKAVQSSKQTVTINAVLGVLFETKTGNAAKYDLLEKASDVVNVNSTIKVKGSFISQLVSSMNLNNYFTYSGSLTTPPHSTNVIWIVLRDPLSVSSAQLALLRKLKSHEGSPITENFRQIQPLYNRVVCCRQRGT